MAFGFGIWRQKGSQATVDDLSGRFRQSPHVLATTQGDETVLLDMKGEQYYTLNEVGTRIWALLGPGATRPQIVDVIRREYGMPADQPDDPVEQDVARLIRDLHAAGLVVSERPEPRGAQAHW